MASLTMGTIHGFLPVPGMKFLLGQKRENPKSEYRNTKQEANFQSSNNRNKKIGNTLRV